MDSKKKTIKQFWSEVKGFNYFKKGFLSFVCTFIDNIIV